ncbi:glycosyltransferase family 4 protein [Bacteroides sp.]|uniref:glycosyltransferase family 4 protein n=1 Tax=Bacteroides sp. TaxID=29523 RepID=UPI0025C574AF|nr:glycosyltransferase family 4 protein [Bacteroides sp.]
MKILSFGHIPSSVGGRQSSGLANVIYQLAYHVAKQDGVEMTMAATDVFVPELHKDALTILGWTKEMLMKHALKHPCTAAKILVNTLSCKIKYSLLVSVPGLFFKNLLLDYAIRKVHPKVVHLHGVVAMYYLPVVPSNVKVVVTLHGNVGTDNNLPNREVYAKLENALCLSSGIDSLCTISTTIPKILKEEYGTIVPPVNVILNAYDNSVFGYGEPKKHKKITLCTIASFSKLKGQERVIEALRNSNCDYRYLCIGHISKANKAMIEEKAKNLDFEWLGVKKPSEIREILAECDYMILPSSSEGFGLVYLEAIACGVPVIIPQHLPLAQEGDILKESNAICIEDSSSKAIEAVLPSLQDKEWDKKAVSESIISHTWDNIAKEYAAQYVSLIKD